MSKELEFIIVKNDLYFECLNCGCKRFRLSHYGKGAVICSLCEKFYNKLLIEQVKIGWHYLPEELANA